MSIREGDDKPIIEEPGIPAESTPEISPIDVIISYVMTTPGNTNPAISKQLIEKAIDAAKEEQEGGVAPEPAEDPIIKLRVYDTNVSEEKEEVGTSVEITDIDIGEEANPEVSVKGIDDNENVEFTDDLNLDGSLNVRFIMPNKDVLVSVDHPVEGNNKETK